MICRVYTASSYGNNFCFVSCKNDARCMKSVDAGSWGLKWKNESDADMQERTRESNVDVRDRGSVGIWTEVFTGCKNFLWSGSLMSLSDVNVLHCRRLQSLLTVTNRQISIIYVPVKRLRPPQITRKKKAPSLSVHTWRNASPVGMRQHIISLPLPVRLTRLTYL